MFSRFFPCCRQGDEARPLNGGESGTELSEPIISPIPLSKKEVLTSSCAIVTCGLILGVVGGVLSFWGASYLIGVIGISTESGDLEGTLELIATFAGGGAGGVGGMFIGAASTKPTRESALACCRSNV
ncbi:MAG: hypothetical protein CMF50_03195 [Legionellales bacterium]|nr:hypothetical protein [Legionellales bacterium]|tara:strand:- start:21851 stop:22234 length:384 start_codon:yes stop_codon:yes gene_type:complete